MLSLKCVLLEPPATRKSATGAASLPQCLQADRSRFADGCQPTLLLPTAEALCSADLETRQQLAQIWLNGSYVEPATAAPTRDGQDVHPLHHAEILMVEDMAMRDKAA